MFSDQVVRQVKGKFTYFHANKNTVVDPLIHQKKGQEPNLRIFAMGFVLRILVIRNSAEQDQNAAI